MFASAFLFYAFGRSAPSLFKSLPAFFFGMISGIVAACVQHILYGAFGFNPSSVFFKAVENIVFDAVFPFAFLVGVNRLFFPSAMDSGEPSGFAGWFVPQCFGFFSVYSPYSLFKRYSPADPLFFFFYAFSVILSVFLLRASFVRVRSGSGFVRDARDVFAAVAAPAVSSACYAVVSAFWFFAMPTPAFVSVSVVFLAAVLILALFMGGKTRRES